MTESVDRIFSETPLPSRDGCGLCGSKENTFLCTDCEVMIYCSREHQTKHRSAHNDACNTVVEAKQGFKDAEATLKQSHEDPFKEFRGKFGYQPSTKDYIAALHKYANALYAVRTRLGAEKSLEHLLELLSLNREDDYGVRFQAPYLFLRLDRAQDCYDCLWWWAVVSNDFAFDWRDPARPFMDTKGADAFAEENCFRRYYAEFALAIPTILLKIKMRSDLRQLHKTRRALASISLPREIEEEILKHSCQTDIVAFNKKIIHGEASYWRELEKVLDEQIRMLAQFTMQLQREIWKVFHCLVVQNDRRADLFDLDRTSMEDCFHWVDVGADAWKEDEDAKAMLVKFKDMTD